MVFNEWLKQITIKIDTTHDYCFQNVVIIPPVIASIIVLETTLQPLRRFDCSTQPILV